MSMENFNTGDPRPKQKLFLPISSDDLLGKVWMYNYNQRLNAFTENMPKIWGIVSFVNKIPKGEQQSKFKDLASEFGLSDLATSKLLSNVALFENLEESNITGLEVKMPNGAIVLIDGNSTAESIKKETEQKGEKIHEQQIVEKTKKEAAGYERNNELLEELKSLDFSDVEGVIENLLKYNLQAWFGLPNSPKEEILKVFGAHGYTREKNDSLEGLLGETLNDKERYGKVIIGYMLDNMGLIRNDEEVRGLINRWKDMQ